MMREVKKAGPEASGGVRIGDCGIKGFSVQVSNFLFLFPDT
jgi:hypothetical protein